MTVTSDKETTVIVPLTSYITLRLLSGYMNVRVLWFLDLHIYTSSTALHRTRANCFGSVEAKKEAAEGGSTEQSHTFSLNCVVNRKGEGRGRQELAESSLQNGETRYRHLRFRFSFHGN